MNVTKQKLEDLYIGKRLTISECAAVVGCSRSALCRKLHKFGIESRSAWDRKAVITKERLEDLYVRQNLSTLKCAKVLGYSSTSGVIYQLRKLGIKSRPIGRFDHRIPGITRERLEDLYINQGLTVQQCAEVLGLPTHGAVVWRLHEFGIPTRPGGFPAGYRPRTCLGGDSHGSWKGGKKAVACTQCGNTLRRFPSLIGERNFCNFACRGQWESENLKGEANPNFGNHVLAGKYAGERSPNWMGGISAEPYAPIWIDKRFKAGIRERDGHECQNPDCRKNGDRLAIHHIDYDKKNCNPKNLITLCVSCNARANFNRDFWEAGYREIIRLKYAEDRQQIAV